MGLHIFNLNGNKISLVGIYLEKKIHLSEWEIFIQILYLLVIFLYNIGEKIEEFSKDYKYQQDESINYWVRKCKIRTKGLLY